MRRNALLGVSALALHAIQKQRVNDANAAMNRPYAEISGCRLVFAVLR